MEPNRVLVGVGVEDLDRATHIAVTARHFAGPKLMLKLIHVHRLRQMVIMDYTYTEPPERVMDELKGETEQLKAIADKLEGPVDIDVIVGSPISAILAEAKPNDLLVIGRTHLDILSRILQGSVESNLVHKAPCPVLVVP